MRDFGFLREDEAPSGWEFSKGLTFFQIVFRATCNDEVIRITHQIDLCRTRVLYCSEQFGQFMLQAIQRQISQNWEMMPPCGVPAGALGKAFHFDKTCFQPLPEGCLCPCRHW